MVKIAIVCDDEYIYPIFRISERPERLYCIDLGGAMGMSDPLPYENDVKAISFLQRVIPLDPYEC